MYLRALLMSVLIFNFGSGLGAMAKQCEENLPAEPVPYCTLVRNPGEYDGKLVLTEAIWESAIHSGVLASQACPPKKDLSTLTLPSFSKGSNFNSVLRRRLWKILGEGRTARVDVIGIFRANRGRDYGPDAQRFKIDIHCLLRVSEFAAGAEAVSVSAISEAE
jgi:hypothetical protein